MPAPRTTPELNEKARRASRLSFAKKRMRAMLDVEPRFTAEDIEELVAILRGGANGQR
jgi:hypothetical protein